MWTISQVIVMRGGKGRQTKALTLKRKTGSNDNKNNSTRNTGKHHREYISKMLETGTKKSQCTTMIY